MSRAFTDSIVVPVANEEDARETARALEPYDIEHVTILFVIEKGEGVPDKTPVEQSERMADKSFATFHEKFPRADVEVAYRRDVIDGILDVASGIDASAIVFRPRGGSRIVQFLSGDKSLRLITEADRPVIALPDPPSEDEKETRK